MAYAVGPALAGAQSFLHDERLQKGNAIAQTKSHSPSSVGGISPAEKASLLGPAGLLRKGKR